MSFRNKKAFTLIELIVVIAVLGILVLLAMPKFLGYTEKSKVTVIRHDVKVAENKMTESLMNGPEELLGWDDLEDSKEYLSNLIDEGKLFDIHGVVKIDEDDELELDGFKIIPNYMLTAIGTNLTGGFYSNTGGKVYYEHTKGSKGTNTNNDNLDANNCPITGYVPVNLADYLDYELAEAEDDDGNIFTPTVKDLLNMTQADEALIYKKNELIYLYIESEGKIVFSDIDTLSILMKEGPFGSVTVNQELYYLDFGSEGPGSAMGKLSLPKYKPTYNDDGIIEDCYKAELDKDIEGSFEIKCNLIGSGETVAEYFDKHAYFLTTKGNLYAIDATSKNNELLLGENTNKVSNVINLGGTHYIIYDTNDGIRARKRLGFEDGSWERSDRKIEDGSLKDIHNGMILTTDGKLYNVGNYANLELIDTGVKELIKGIGDTEGYIDSDNNYIISDFGKWTNAGKYNNITFSTSLHTDYIGTSYIVSNGALYSWGNNKSGHLGNSTSSTVYNKTIHKVLIPDNNVKIIDMLKHDYLGIEVTFALADNGNVYYWGGRNRNSNTPVLYETNVKSFVNIQGADWSYSDILLHYNDNSTGIVRLHSNKIDLYTEPFLDNVTYINNLGSEVAIKVENELYLYSRDLSYVTRHFSNVSEHREVMREENYGDYTIYYKITDDKYYEHQSYNSEDATIEIDKDKYDNIITTLSGYNANKGKKIFFEILKNKLCITGQVDYTTSN